MTLPFRARQPRLSFACLTTPALAIKTATARWPLRSGLWGSRVETGRTNQFSIVTELEFGGGKLLANVKANGVGPLAR